MVVVHDPRMKTMMQFEELVAIDQLTAFLAATQSLAFSGNSSNNLPNLTSQINGI